MPETLHPVIVAERAIHERPDGFKLHKDAVWPTYDENNDYAMVTEGLVVAKTDEKCPIFKDKVPMKSVTVVFDPTKFPENEVEYWLGYVHGGEYSTRFVMTDGTVALRSNYQAW